MDNAIPIFWFTIIASLSGLIRMMRVQTPMRGWIVVYLAILAVATIGFLSNQPSLIYAAAGMWVVLILVPSISAQVYHRHLLQQNYQLALRAANLVRILHPADGWNQQPKLIEALHLAKQGQLEAASKILESLQTQKPPIGTSATINLYRINNQWEEMNVWMDKHPDHQKTPLFSIVLLRAKGETGNIQGLVETYYLNQEKIRKLVPDSLRDQCRLILFAFCGRKNEVERTFAHGLKTMPESTKNFWRATADWASGAPDAARNQLEQLLFDPDPTLRSAVQRRLSQINIPPIPLQEPSQRILEKIASEHAQDVKLGAKRKLFSKEARGTQILIGLNLIMFMLELAFGGSTNMDTLYHLGAMYPPAVKHGDWWRMVASLFLHFGPFHLAMNMGALIVLGPFTEFVFGVRRYILLYFLVGIGSMGTILLFASSPQNDRLTVGASGSIMGLVGATGAIMLRGWIIEKAIYAKRRLKAIILVICLQTAFDALVPQVSMTAHLSGAIIGFLVGLILPLKHD